MDCCTVGSTNEQLVLPAKSDSTRCPWETRGINWNLFERKLTTKEHSRITEEISQVMAEECDDMEDY